MNTKNVTKVFKDVKKGVIKHSPEILTGIGIAGMVISTVFAVQATPKAIKLINEAEKENGKKLDKYEVVKVAWKPYLPAIITGTASTVCLIGSCRVNTRRMAALTTAYKLSETALKEFKNKAVEVVGEKKVKEIREKISNDKVEQNPVSESKVIITGKGSTLCMDTISNQYFMSDIETIRKAVNELNRQMVYDMYVSLTEFYNAIGLPSTKISDDLGWNLDDGLIEIDFGSRIADDGRPCITLDYNIAPKYDFSKLM